MQAFQNSYRGLRLLMRLNLDFLFHVFILAVALLAGAYLGSL